jgi:Ca2+-binding RTX toxin-like protein
MTFPGTLAGPHTQKGDHAMSRMRNTIRRAAMLLGATAAAAAVAVPAQAAQLSKSDGVDDSNGKPYSFLFYDAQPGVDNQLRLTTNSNQTQITFDDVETINAPSGCSQPANDKTVATCGANEVLNVLVRLDNGKNTFDNLTPFRSSVSAAKDSRNEFNGGTGSDELTGGDNADDLWGAGGDDRVEGGKGDDVLHGGAGDDELLGGDGNDSLEGGTNADELHGGAGEDIADYTARTKVLSVTIGSSADDGESGEGDNVASDVEDVGGGSAGDTIVAQSGNVVNGLYGNGGDDTIIAGGGNDAYVVGGQGSDDLRGEGGNDGLYGSPGVDFLWGGAGTDVLNAGSGDDQLSGGPDADTFNGSTGTDTAYYADVADRVTVSLDGATGNDGAQGEGDTVKGDVENILGGLASDRLTGDAGANVIRGGAGNDVVDGGLGADQLFGDADRDTLRARDGIADTVSCGADEDDAEVDKLDTLTACETVDRGDAPSNPQNPDNPQNPQNPDNPQNAATGKLTISPTKLRLDRKGFAKLSVSCPKGVSKKCTGSVKVQRTAKGKTVTVGSRKFKVAAGRTVAVKVKVQKTVRKALARKKVKVTVVASARDAASTTVTASKKVTLLRTAR